MIGQKVENWPARGFGVRSSGFRVQLMNSESRKKTRIVIWPLLALFGTLYFIQGIIEPTACLPAQPIQSHLRLHQFSAEQIGQFFGVIGLAWSLKPLFGLLSDFLPIGGYRRAPYLLISTAAASLAFLGVAALWNFQAPNAGSWFGPFLGVVPGQPVSGLLCLLLV